MKINPQRLEENSYRTVHLFTVPQVRLLCDVDVSIVRDFTFFSKSKNATFYVFEVSFQKT